MNELVERLTITKNNPVETACPEKTAKALKECIDRDYVHVMFKKTGTEIGMQLDRRDSKFADKDFELGKGKAHLVGFLTLNYDKVRCVADINLATCKGTGHLEPVDEEEYYRVIKKEEVS